MHETDVRPATPDVSTAGGAKLALLATHIDMLMQRDSIRLAMALPAYIHEPTASHVAAWGRLREAGRLLLLQSAGHQNIYR